MSDEDSEVMAKRRPSRARLMLRFMAGLLAALASVVPARALDVGSPTPTPTPIPQETPTAAPSVREAGPRSGTGTSAGAVTVNLTTAGTATQSGTAHGGVAPRAIDGDTNGIYSAGSVTHTSMQTDPWWEVDLGRLARIDSIAVWNRGDCCQDRLANFYVLVSGSPHPQPGAAVFEQLVAGPAGRPTEVAVGVVGRYVRIQVQGSGVLSLAEVQVFGEPLAIVNLAQGASARQPSTAHGGVASRAVDGNTNGAYAAGSVTHTGAQANPWWEVDLGRLAQIDSIAVWNRSDCCQDRLTGFHVLVSRSPDAQPGSAGFARFEIGTAGRPTEIPVDAIGRYVRIQLQGTGVLSLAEVEVLGRPLPSGANLARGALATQRSTVHGGVASRAVDGNTDGVYAAGSVTHTGAHAGAWWEVDLGAMAQIDSIAVWNRGDCCQDRLAGYRVLVSSAPNPQPGGAAFEHFEAAQAGRPTIIPVGALGRYVRIQLQGSGVLSLAEVEVFGSASPLVNLAASGSARQISTAHGGVAPRAIDGNTDGNYGAGSVTHTGSHLNPWWEVDLGAAADIDSVAVWNRSDCCQDRLASYWVLVSNTPNPQPGSAAFQHLESSIAGRPTTIAVNATGRYVRIQAQGTGVLSLAEVQVWSPSGDEAVYVGQRMSPVLTAGEQAPVQVRLRNTGSTPWTAGSGHQLVDAAGGWGVPPQGIPLGESVQPGQEWTFSFRVTAPSTPGDRDFQWQLQRDGEAAGQASPLASVAVVAPSNVSAHSLRFNGNGEDDIDRVKIRLDDPAVAGDPGPPADVGSGDFTVELWIKGSAVANDAPAQACGDNINWIFGNIIVDRDRFNQARKFGVSIAGGSLIFGVSGDGSGSGSNDRTICGSTPVVDGEWHHVAVQRRRSDGRLWIFVDGQLEAVADGPDGDVSYPDDAVPCANCCGGGSCAFSDPFLVIGAEKHDADNSTYPSFDGWIDEVRISNTLRYSSSFAPPTAPFTPDAATAALYHFDEGNGDRIIDASSAPGGPSPGRRRFGGAPAGPLWSVDTPFPTAPAISLALAGTAPSSIVAIATAGDHRLFLAGREGRIYVYDGVQVLPAPFLDIDDLVGAPVGEQGLLGLVFHPDYLTNGFFFVNYTDDAGDTVVARYRRSFADPDVADWRSGVTLLGIDQPAVNHNGGQLAFGSDGMLYAAFGDGGGGGDPNCLAQRDDTLLGKILRLDVDQNADSAPFYGIPPDNPFVGGGGLADEVWAEGLRNPWRFTFDRLTGGAFIADVGQRAREEVNYQDPDSLGGENYGWKVMEGSLCYIDDCPNEGPNCHADGCPANLPPCNDASLEMPILEYPHTAGCSITGGYAYRGRSLPDLSGAYLYADFCSREIWIGRNDAGDWSDTPVATAPGNVYTFGEDAAGELYVSTGGSIFRVQ